MVSKLVFFFSEIKIKIDENQYIFRMVIHLSIFNMQIYASFPSPDI